MSQQHDERNVDVRLAVGSEEERARWEQHQERQSQYSGGKDENLSEAEANDVFLVPHLPDQASGEHMRRQESPFVGAHRGERSPKGEVPPDDSVVLPREHVVEPHRATQRIVRIVGSRIECRPERHHEGAEGEARQDEQRR